MHDCQIYFFPEEKHYLMGRQRKSYGMHRIPERVKKNICEAHSPKHIAKCIAAFMATAYTFKINV